MLPARAATAVPSSGGSSIRSTLAGSSASRSRTCCVASSCSSRQVSSSISGRAAAASAAARATSTDTGSDQCRSSSTMSSGWRAAAAATPSTIATAISSRPTGPATAPSSWRGNSRPMVASERRHGHSGGMPAAEHAPWATLHRGRPARLPAPWPAQPVHGRGRRAPGGRQRAGAYAHSTRRPAAGESSKLRPQAAPAPRRPRCRRRPAIATTWIAQAQAKQAIA